MKREVPMFSRDFLEGEETWQAKSSSCIYTLEHIYRPPTKLQESNIFHRVCVSLFMGGLGGSCTGSWLRSPLCTGHWPHPHICSNLFNLDLTVQVPPDMFTTKHRLSESRWLAFFLLRSTNNLLLGLINRKEINLKQELTYKVWLLHL